MRCKETGCDGEVDLTTPVTLQVGCRSVDHAYPCSRCGRLHWNDGSAVQNRAGQKAFLRDGKVVNMTAKSSALRRAK